MKQTKHLTALLLLALSLLTAVTALVLCAVGQNRDTLVLRELPDPQDTAVRFLDAVCARDYALAYSCLPGDSDLGLQNLPETPEAARFWALLRNNTRWAPAGECTQSGLSAQLPITLRCPDLAALTADLQSDVNTLLAERVAAAALSAEVYQEDGSYRDEVVLEAYAAALDARLSAETLPERSFSLTLSLELEDDQWFVVPDAALLSALCGGAA